MSILGDAIAPPLEVVDVANDASASHPAGMPDPVFFVGHLGPNGGAFMRMTEPLPTIDAARDASRRLGDGPLKRDAWIFKCEALEKAQ